MSSPQLTFKNTNFAAGSFLESRRDVTRSATLLYQLQMLKDTGRYTAFQLKWHHTYNDPPSVWPVPNHLFWDSDVAKWIEGACYFLHEQQNEEIEKAVHELVQMIASAQQEDGYINIHFTVVKPGERFTNLRDLHELYNAGHLIEAAIAHHQFFKTDALLAPIVRYANLLCRTFSKEGIKAYCGHPEIELALLRLYEVTQDESYLRLATFFITERGNVQNGHYYDIESEARGDRPNEMPKYYPERRSYWYQQAHKPLLEQRTIEGHSVRAMYLLTAVADLIRISTSAKDYATPLFDLWENMVGKKMYVTGGIGAIAQYEGFGTDFFLPQSTDEGGCYAETCAAIGVMMLGERILQLRLDACYADIVELALYNAVLTGMSLDGKKFTYVNQLASSDTDLSERHGWFECACCPPNVTRTLGCLGGYMWSAVDDNTINIHLYNAMTITHVDTSIKIDTEWPWQGRVKLTVQGGALNIRLRVPSWAQNWSLLTADGVEIKVPFIKGYLHLSQEVVSKNPSFVLDVVFAPRIIRTHPFASSQTLNIARGPIVYCAEDVDNTWVQDHFKKTALISSPQLEDYTVNDKQSGEKYIGIRMRQSALQLDLQSWTHVNRTWNSSLDPNDCAGKAQDLVLIPYYFRANRTGNGMMRVGFRQAHV